MGKRLTGEDIMLIQNKYISLVNHLSIFDIASRDLINEVCQAFEDIPREVTIEVLQTKDIIKLLAEYEKEEQDIENNPISIKTDSDVSVELFDSISKCYAWCDRTTVPHKKLSPHDYVQFEKDLQNALTSLFNNVGMEIVELEINLNSKSNSVLGEVRHVNRTGVPIYFHIIFLAYSPWVTTLFTGFKKGFLLPVVTLSKLGLESLKLLVDVRLPLVEHEACLNHSKCGMTNCFSCKNFRYDINWLTEDRYTWKEL